ncbi:uncharacterized protein [Notamacropus eugenii]|uniref:uncharacterized protein n=1 Tax=Notamacropus eugenii TaxID=9315 RepID=UPI003B680C91
MTHKELSAIPDGAPDSGASIKSSPSGSNPYCSPVCLSLLRKGSLGRGGGHNAHKAAKSPIPQRGQGGFVVAGVVLCGSLALHCACLEKGQQKPWPASEPSLPGRSEDSATPSAHTICPGRAAAFSGSREQPHHLHHRHPPPPSDHVCLMPGYSLLRRCCLCSRRRHRRRHNSRLRRPGTSQINNTEREVNHALFLYTSGGAPTPSGHAQNHRRRAHWLGSSGTPSTSLGERVDQLHDTFQLKLKHPVLISSRVKKKNKTNPKYYVCYLICCPSNQQHKEYAESLHAGVRLQNFQYAWGQNSPWNSPEVRNLTWVGRDTGSSMPLPLSPILLPALPPPHIL